MVFKGSKPVVTFFLILIIAGCSKKETPISNQEDLIGEWEWVETFLLEYDFHNDIAKYDTIPPHKIFRMTYTPKGKVTLFQDEIPNGQMYNSYIRTWHSNAGHVKEGKTIFGPGNSFIMVLNRPFILNKGKDFEFKEIQGVYSSDCIFIFGERNSYFDIPHPSPDYVNYETIAILKRVGN